MQEEGSYGGGRGFKRGWGSYGRQRRGWNSGWNRGRGSFHSSRGGSGWKRGASNFQDDDNISGEGGRPYGKSKWGRASFRGMPLPKPSQSYQKENGDTVDPFEEGHPQAGNYMRGKFSTKNSRSAAFGADKVSKFPEENDAANDDEFGSDLPQTTTLIRAWVEVPICRADRRQTPYHGAALYLPDSVEQDFVVLDDANNRRAGSVVARLLRVLNIFLESERTFSARVIGRIAARRVFKLDYSVLTRADSVIHTEFDRDEFTTLFETHTDLVLAACGLLLYDKVARSWIDRFKQKRAQLNLNRTIQHDENQRPMTTDAESTGCNPKPDSSHDAERINGLQREFERTMFAIDCPRFVAVRLSNYSQNRLPVGAIRSAAFGRLVTVSALVARVAPRESVPYRVAFRCSICGAHKILQSATLNGSIAPSFSGMPPRFVFPERCGAHFGVDSRSVACRSNTFDLMEDPNLTEFVPTQVVTLQELVSGSTASSDPTLEERDAFGEDEDRSVATVGARGVPKTIDALLNREMVDTCEPGQHVTVVGVVRTKDGPAAGNGASSWHNQAANRFRGAAARVRRHFYLHVLSISISNTNEERDDPFATALAVSNLNGQTVQDEAANSSSQPCASTQQQSQAMFTATAAATAALPNPATRDESFSPAERALIESFRDDPQSARTVFPRLVASLCPHIYGHEMVKAGLVLALFGGAGARIETKSDALSTATASRNANQRGATKRSFNESSRDLEPDSIPGSNAAHSLEERFAARFRENCHVLMVGDPGIGKSQLLSAIARCAPRSTTVSGESATACGLTCALVKARTGGTSGSTAFRESFVLEAGALVLADRGVCCVDEFTHLRSEMSALLEALEQQTVSVAKAGILCTLPARTTLVAASNPAGGRYDTSRCLAENVQLPPALLSRFDLIFTMIDIPDAERDRLLTEHIFDFRAAASASSNAASRTRARGTEDESSADAPNWRAAVVSTPLEANARPSELEDLKQGLEATDLFRQVNRELDQLFSSVDSSLADRLKKIVPALVRSDRNGCAQLLSSAFIRRYVAYSRAHCRPSLDRAAASFLKRCYVQLRARSADEQQISSVTPRHLQSLVRLTQARARCELRSRATESDAREVVEIMSETLLKLFYEGASANASLNYSLINSSLSGGVSQRGTQRNLSKSNASLLDKTRSAGGVSQSNRKVSKQKEFAALLYTVVDKRTADPDCPIATRNLFSTTDLRDLGKLINMNAMEFDQLITRLNQDGTLLKVSAGTYKLLHTGE